jgi:hypothetical protein
VARLRGVREKAARWVRRAGAAAVAWNWRREVARRKDMVVVVGCCGLMGFEVRCVD